MSVIEQFEKALAGVNHQVIPIPHNRIQAYAQNVNGHPALLVRIGDQFAREVDGTGGISVRVDGVGVPNRCLRFESESQGITPMFAAIVSSLLDVDDSDPVGMMLDNYDELRAMFARRSGRLGEQAVRGVFAELVMLLALRDGGSTPSAALNAWQGPYRVAKDFILPHGQMVEVKSIRRANRHVRISSVDQLDPRGEDLRLAVLTLDSASGDEGVSLLELLNEVNQWVDADPASRSLLAQAILALGIDTDDPYYRRWRFSVGEWQWYSVAPDFPRIEESCVPPAVSRISYSLDTDALEPFATEPFWKAESTSV